MTIGLLVIALGPVIGLTIYDWYTSDGQVNPKEDELDHVVDQEEEIVPEIIDDCFSPVTDYLYYLVGKYLYPYGDYIYPYVAHLIPEPVVLQKIIGSGLFFLGIALWTILTHPYFAPTMGPIKEWLGKNLFGSLGGTDENADSTPKKVTKVTDDLVAKSEEENEMLLCFKEPYIREAYLRERFEVFKEYKGYQEKLLESSSDLNSNKELKGLKTLVDFRMKNIAVEVRATASFLHEKVQEFDEVAKAASNLEIDNKSQVFEKKFYEQVDSKNYIKKQIQWFYFHNTGHKYVTGKYVDIPVKFQVSLKRLHVDASGKRIPESDRVFVSKMESEK
jgi:hypothetical protein